MLYKYRTLKDFKYTVDILVNNRLFGAKYTDLNDPMEGHYLYQEGLLSNEQIFHIKDEKEGYKIVSLSELSTHPLMWSHYADGGKGIAIGVELSSETNNQLHSINYTSSLAEIDDLIKQEISPREIARKVLTTKIAEWKYEQEKRILFNNYTNFTPVNVIEVILGRRIESADEELLRNLISKINPLIQVKRFNDVD